MTDSEKIARLSWFVEGLDEMSLAALQKGESPVVLFDAESTLSALRAIVNGDPSGGFVGVEGARRKVASAAACKTGKFYLMFPNYEPAPVAKKD